MEFIKIGTLTSAQRAGAILAVSGIGSRRRRIAGNNGCSYGVEVDRKDYHRAVNILTHAGIAVQ